jgi:hypothetical protein
MDISIDDGKQTTAGAEEAAERPESPDAALPER